MLLRLLSLFLLVILSVSVHHETIMDMQNMKKIEIDIDYMEELMM